MLSELPVSIVILRVTAWALLKLVVNYKVYNSWLVVAIPCSSRKTDFLKIASDALR